MKRVIAQARKELTQVFAIVSQSFSLCTAANSASALWPGNFVFGNRLPVVVQDLDRTPLSRKYIDALNASLTFHLKPLPFQNAARGVSGS